MAKNTDFGKSPKGLMALLAKAQMMSNLAHAGEDITTCMDSTLLGKEEREVLGAMAKGLALICSDLLKDITDAIPKEEMEDEDEPEEEDPRALLKKLFEKDE